MASDVTTQYYAKCLNCGAVEAFWSARWKADTTCKKCGKSGVKNWTIPSGDELGQSLVGKPVYTRQGRDRADVGVIKSAEMRVGANGVPALFVECEPLLTKNHSEDSQE